MARPVEFNREDVLQKAMLLFWRNGYAATSISDLAVAMDMRPGSIYSAFESKQALMLEAMACYAESARRGIQATLFAGSGKRESFAALFERMAGEMACETRPKGCLIINLLLELSRLDESAGEHARKHLDAVKAIFREALIEAEAGGELNAGQSISDYATFLLGAMFALRVMGRAAARGDEMKVFYEQALKHVFVAG